MEIAEAIVIASLVFGLLFVYGCKQIHLVVRHSINLETAGNVHIENAEHVNGCGTIVQGDNDTFTQSVFNAPNVTIGDVKKVGDTLL